MMAAVLSPARFIILVFRMRSMRRKAEHWKSIELIRDAVKLERDVDEQLEERGFRFDQLEVINEH